MAKKISKKSSRKDSITLTRNGFIALILFIIAVTMLGVYAYLGYAAVK